MDISLTPESTTLLIVLGAIFAYLVYSSWDTITSYEKLFPKLLHVGVFAIEIDVLFASRHFVPWLLSQALERGTVLFKSLDIMLFVVLAIVVFKFGSKVQKHLESSPKTSVESA